MSLDLMIWAQLAVPLDIGRLVIMAIIVIAVVGNARMILESED